MTLFKEYVFVYTVCVKQLSGFYNFLEVYYRKVLYITPESNDL